MPKIFDTLTSSHLLNENLPENGLKYLAEYELGIPKEQIKKYTEVIPGTEEFFEYGMNDAIWTYQLYKKYSPQIEKEGLHHLAYDIEFPFQRALMHLAINGIAADTKAAKKMKEEVSHLSYQIEDEMLQLFGKGYDVGITPRGRKVFAKPQINFNSGQQVAETLQSLGIKLTEKTKKGNLATTTQVLERLKSDIERKLNGVE